MKGPYNDHLRKVWEIQLFVYVNFESMTKVRKLKSNMSGVNTEYEWSEYSDQYEK